MVHKKREGRYESGEGPRHERGESRRYEATERTREALKQRTAGKKRDAMYTAMQAPAGAMRISGGTRKKQ